MSGLHADDLSGSHGVDMSSSHGDDMSGSHSATFASASSSLPMTAPRRNDRAYPFGFTSWQLLEHFDSLDGGTNSTTADADGFVAETQRPGALNINQYQPPAPDLAGVGQMLLSPLPLFSDHMRENGATLVMGTSPCDSLVPGEPLSSQTPSFQFGTMRHESLTPPMEIFPVDASLPPRSEYVVAEPLYVSLPLVFPSLPTPADPFPPALTFPVLSTTTSSGPVPPQAQRQDGRHQEATAPHGKTAIVPARRKPQRKNKLQCHHCTDSPEGFRSEYERKRHFKRRHALRRLTWVCQDPHNDTPEGWRLFQPLDTCKNCRDQKPYNESYNAAEHLLREHFRPKGDRRVSGLHRTAAARDSRTKLLRHYGWVTEIEVVSEDAVTTTDGTATATTDYMRTGTGTRMDTMSTGTTLPTTAPVSMPQVENNPTWPDWNFTDSANFTGVGDWV